MFDEPIMLILFVTILSCILYLIFDGLWINQKKKKKKKKKKTLLIANLSLKF